MQISIDSLSDVSSGRTPVPDESGDKPEPDALACLSDAAASVGSGGCEALADLSDNDVDAMFDEAGVVAAVTPRSRIPPACGPRPLAEVQGVRDAPRPSPYADRQWPARVLGDVLVGLGAAARTTIEQ